MENKIVIYFIKENEEIVLDFEQPDLSILVKKVLSKHLKVTKENIKIESTVDEFDVEEFKDILLTVHEEFSTELDQFFENIKNEITTYYDETLSEEIIKRINNTDNDE